MSPPEMLSTEALSPLSVEDFCYLANSFSEQGEFERAIQIYERASKLYPENLAIKISLGRIRSLRNQALDSPKDIISSRPSHEDDEIWANRFQGLGEIFLKNGRREEARRIFEMSKASNVKFYLPYLNLGKLYLEMNELEHAIAELERAISLNPFNEEVADLLATARFQNRDYKEALDLAIDAFVLSGEANKKGGKGPYSAKIKTYIEKLPSYTTRARNDRIRERRNRIQLLYEELEGQLNRYTSTAPIPSTSPSTTTDQTATGEPTEVTISDPGPPPPEAASPLDEMVVALRKHLIFRNMEEAAIRKVAQFTSPMDVRQSEYVYQEGDPVYGLYLLSRGKVEIQKATPYGPIIFTAFEKGSFFGDDNLLSGRERYTSALSIQDSEILFIDKAGLANIFARERSIAIHFLWYFWTSLSRQIREANDRMTSFFAGPQEAAERFAAPSASGRPANVEIDKKLEVLQAKGLSPKDLTLLTKFSNAEVYNRGETIFREGDLGDRLYIVLEGSIRISKHIAGTGEEALAILKKGDFFGEMALLGQHYRSADAKAQEQGTTVLAITKEALREILSIDTDSAYQFLTILCRILSQRLREINEKIYQWKLMSGEFK